MNRNRSGQRSDFSSPFQRRGRPRVHNIEADIELVRYVEDRRKRTGCSINTICRYGAFVQAISGSPESCPAGPDRPTVLHVIRAATLRRRYFEARSRLQALADSRDQCQAEPNWITGWINLKAAKP
jgi:hypothetical protein